MKLTQKDAEFLERLKELIQSKDLHVELKTGWPSHMVLKGTYGEKIHKTFGVTRQGVRWRFQHIFGKIYVEAFLAILAVEKIFGTQLRDYAIRISKEQYTIREQHLNKFGDIDRMR